jgi:hypothetical protein
MTAGSQASPAQAAFRWTGRVFYIAALSGMVVFGAYILLRSTGATFQNFHQWKDVIAGTGALPPADWIAGLGIGLHYFMGAVLVLAWPILFSSRIRVRHRVLHRWTGRVYVTAGLLAGVGGLSFILAKHDGGAAHIAFAIWGSVMMLSAAMAYVHARARRFEQRVGHPPLRDGAGVVDLRPGIPRLGGHGRGRGHRRERKARALRLRDQLWILRAEPARRRVLHPQQAQAHRRQRAWRWAGLAAAVFVGAVFVYSIVAVTATPSGKYGKHLLELLSRG